MQPNRGDGEGARLGRLQGTTQNDNAFTFNDTLPTGDRDRHARYAVSYKATLCHCHSANTTALRDTEDTRDFIDARAERERVS